MICFVGGVVNAESFEAECKHENWERGETIEPHYIYENGELVDEVNLYWVECNECGAIGDEFVEGEGPTRIKWDAESFGGIVACKQENCPHGHCPRCGNCDDVLDNDGDGSEDDDNPMFCGACGESFSAESFGADEDFEEKYEGLLGEDGYIDFDGIKRCIEEREEMKELLYDAIPYIGTPDMDTTTEHARGLVERINQWGAESFEAPGEVEEEDFIPMDITQCHVCARPYEYSRIARALVQHYLKESDDGTKGWKNKSTPDGTRRTARNIAGYQLYWYGLGALENYLEEGKISKMTPMVIDLLRTAIVPNIIAGDVVQFIESMEIDDIEDTDPTFFTDFQTHGRLLMIDYDLKDHLMIRGIGVNTERNLESLGEPKINQVNDLYRYITYLGMKDV